jgi:dihydrofolate reductase
MTLATIVAATDNDVISKGNKIPWRMPGDMAYLRSKVKGHPLIMGRATYDSMGKAYPGCTNVVVSRHLKELPDAIVVSSLKAALALDEVKNDSEPFIFGGESIFEAAMPLTEKIYLTRIHAQIEGDRFFHYNPAEWHEVSRDEHKKDKENPYDYDFITLERNQAL